MYYSGNTFKEILAMQRLLPAPGLKPLHIYTIHLVPIFTARRHIHVFRLHDRHPSFVLRLIEIKYGYIQHTIRVKT